MRTRVHRPEAEPHAGLSSAARQAAARAQAGSAALQGQRALIQRCFGGAAPLQRLVDAGSDATLTAQYNHMLANSPTFVDLDERVCGRTNQHPITLNDSTATQAIDYNPTTHSINTPVSQTGGLVAHPLNAVRANLLWEMHNASNKGALGRAVAKQPAALVGGENRAKRLEHAYRMANMALSVEWLEWSKVLENVFRAQALQGDLGQGQIDDDFGAYFSAADSGWYLFSNYLSVQIGGHTTLYDPAANAPNWKGKNILAIANNKSQAAMKCTRAQEQDFRARRKKTVKDEATNPFRSDTHWKAAMAPDY